VSEVAQNKKVIWFVASAYLEVPTLRGGGIQEVIWNVADRISDDFEVHILAPRQRVTDRRRHAMIAACPRVRLHELPPKALKQYPPAEKILPGPRGLSLLFHLIFFNLAVSLHTLGSKDRKRISLILVWDKFSGLILMPIGALLLKVPVLYSESSIWPWLYEPPRGLTNRLRYRANIVAAKFLTKFASAIQANSHSILSGMAAHGIPPSKVAVIPNGVNTAEFSNLGLRTVPFTVGFVGRLVPERGASLLLEVIRETTKVVPAAQFLVAGGGSPEIGKSDVLRAVDVVLGHQDRDVIPKLLSEMTVVLFLSPKENFPSLALLEALASGRVVVATNVGDTGTVIHDGENGILVRSIGSDVAQVLVNLTKNERLCRKLGTNAAETAAQFDWKFIANRYRHLFVSTSLGTGL
jgi:glycosyltransferase involved in cell wall biosynthesis